MEETNEKEETNKSINEIKELIIVCFGCYGKTTVMFSFLKGKIGLYIQIPTIKKKKLMIDNIFPNFKMFKTITK